MKIAIFTDFFLPQINGVVSYVVDIASELVSKGHKIVVFAPKPKRGVKISQKDFSFKLVFLPSLPTFLYPDFRITIPALPKVLLYLRKFGADVIHVQDPLTVGTEGLTAGKILNIPTVITFHTFFMDEEMLKILKIRKKVVDLINNPLWKLTVYYHNLADVVICPSEIAREELVMHGLKAPNQVIHNGINLSKIKILNKNAKVKKRQEIGVFPNDKLGIFVGRISVDKSIEVLIKAFQIVAVKIKESKLLLVGDGPDMGRLKKLVEDLNLADNVLFLGRLPRESIIQGGILSIADFFVTASKIENQSIAILEALAHGLPIIGVNMRGNPELVDDKTGILVEADNEQKLAEAIVKFFSNDKLASILKSGAISTSKKYDLSESVALLEKTYESLKLQK